MPFRPSSYNRTQTPPLPFSVLSPSGRVSYPFSGLFFRQPLSSTPPWQVLTPFLAIVRAAKHAGQVSLFGRQNSMQVLTLSCSLPRDLLRTRLRIQDSFSQHALYAKICGPQIVRIGPRRPKFSGTSPSSIRFTLSGLWIFTMTVYIINLFLHSFPRPLIRYAFFFTLIRWVFETLPIRESFLDQSKGKHQRVKVFLLPVIFPSPIRVSLISSASPSGSRVSFSPFFEASFFPTTTAFSPTPPHQFTPYVPF